MAVLFFEFLAFPVTIRNFGGLNPLSGSFSMEFGHFYSGMGGTTIVQ